MSEDKSKMSSSVAEQSDSWFTECEFPWRVKLSLVWSLIMSGAWLLVINTLAALLQSPLHPWSAVSQAVSTLLFPSSSLVLVVIMAAVVSWSSLSHAVTFSVCRQKHSSVLATVSASLSPRILLSLVSHCVQAVILASCFTRLAWPQLEDPERFVEWSGLLTGAYLGVQYNLLSGNSLRFPVINKDRYSQLVGVLSVREVSLRVVEAVRILQYHGLLSLLTSLSLHLTLPDIFSPSLLAASLTTVVLVLLVHHSTLATASVLLTAPLDRAEPALLLSGLSSTSGLLRLLSLRLLASLASISSQLRSQVFSLSQPGGHPANWKLVSSVCLGNISALLPVKKEAAPAPAPTPAPQYKTVITSPTMRPLAGSGGTKLEDLRLSGSHPAPRLLSLSASLDKLKKVGGAPLSQSDNLLAIIASIDLISELVCYSLTEDKFGVVQRDLSLIITQLCQLDLELANKKVQDFATVKQAVKSGLYRIAIKFGPHIADLGLSSTMTAKLKNYSNMLEC